jgi:NAD(P)-dependent dehydrogenase (short-subunit alcohol dehydrogenase family)
MTMLNGKTILITGATNGIGEVSALELARAGAEVVVVSRNQEKCAATVQKIQSETGNNKVSYIAADLSTLAGIRSAADQFLSKHSTLDVLLNNAGGVFTSRQVTFDGYEMTFALNHLSYFLLTHLLLDTLKATSQSNGEARIVNVSSSAHYSSRGINFNDLQRKQGYNTFGVYADSKLMNILFTNELAKRLQGTGITANSLHPGFVRTGFGKNNGGIVNRIFGLIQMFALSAEEGAQTSIYLASSPEVRGISGKFWDKKKVKTPSAAAQDIAAQEKLWRVSEELTHLTPIQV